MCLAGGQPPAPPAASASAALPREPAAGSDTPAGTQAQPHHPAGSPTTLLQPGWTLLSRQHVWACFGRLVLGRAPSSPSHCGVCSCLCTGSSLSPTWSCPSIWMLRSTLDTPSGFSLMTIPPGPGQAHRHHSYVVSPIPGAGVYEVGAEKPPVGVLQGSWGRGA